MGSVRITENGLQVQGVSEFLNTLYTNDIISMDEVCFHSWSTGYILKLDMLHGL